MAYTEIDDPTAYFQTTLYSGTGSQQSITNGGNSDLQPDWLWIKERDGTSSHQIMDAVRLYYNRIESNNDSAQLDAGQTGATNQNVTSFDSDGFGVKNGGAVNESGKTYVAWQWKAGTALNNSAGANGGSIATTGSISSTSGFGIVKYVGTGSNATIYHGLGKIPRMIITKNIDQTFHWSVYTFHSNTKILRLNGNNAEATETAFQSTDPTTTIQSLGNHNQNNGSGDTHISYMFCDVPGYQKIGSYTGNGNANGTFIYLGFKPAFIIIKKTNAAEDWELFDNKRLGYNVDNNNVVPNTTSAEATSDRLDIVSNGFKFRTAAGSVNASGDSFIYMACASNPFTTSTGVPATAR
jgi:hypothetical protein